MFGAAPSRTQFFGPRMFGGYSGIGGGPMQAQPMPAQPMPGMFGGAAPQMGGMMPGMFGGGFGNPFGGGMMQQPSPFGGGAFGGGMQGGFGGGGFTYGQMVGQQGPQMGQFGGQMPQAGSIVDAQRAAQQEDNQLVGGSDFLPKPPPPRQMMPGGFAGRAGGFFGSQFGGQAPQIRRPTQMGIGSMQSPFMGFNPRQMFSAFQSGSRGFPPMFGGGRGRADFQRQAMRG